jgi:hypothetical protein
VIVPSLNRSSMRLTSSLRMTVTPFAPAPNSPNVDARPHPRRPTSGPVSSGASSISTCGRAEVDAAVSAPTPFKTVK